MDIADAEEALDVGLVGMGAERIDEEKDSLDLSGGDAGGDLGIAAEGAGEEAFDLETCRFGDALSRCAGGDEVERGELLAVALAEGDDFFFLFVVGDEGEGGHGTSAKFTKNWIVHEDHQVH